MNQEQITPTAPIADPLLTKPIAEMTDEELEQLFARNQTDEDKGLTEDEQLPI